MDKKEQQRIERMAENIVLPEDEMRELGIDLQIDLGAAGYASPDTLRRYAAAQDRKHEEELAALMERIKDKPPEVQKRILDQVREARAVASPFEISPEPEIEEQAPADAGPAPVAAPAERADTKVALRVSADKMHAYLSLTPPQGGGRPPSDKALEVYLKKKGVVYGIDRKRLALAAAETAEQGNPVTDFEVATGKPVEEGEDGAVEWKFTEAVPADFAGGIQLDGAERIGTAKKSQVLAIVKPPRPGRPGLTVFGEELKAREVAQPRVECKRNARRAGDTLVAELDGIVHVGPDWVLVKPYADAQADIAVDEDRMAAYVTLIPSVGDGLKLSRELVVKGLKNRDVTYGIDERTIEDAVAKSEADKVTLSRIPVARGEKPVDGTDGKLVFKIRLEASHQLKEQGETKIDFREKDSIVNVGKGDLLAVLFPPQKKQRDGRDVAGNILLGKDGMPVAVKTGKRIESRARPDGVTEFFAAMDGQIMFDDQKLDVEELYVVPGDLTMEIGNIDFLGNVLVKGSIEDNFTVKAGGDIEVKGNVGASTLVAGRDVYVKGGVIARGSGSVRAGRNAALRFAEQANVIATGTVTVDRAVMHSQLAAGDSIRCVKEKGQVIGGHLIARNRVEVNELGASAGAKTEVTIGMDFFRMEELSRLDEDQRKFEQAGEKIGQVLGKLDALKNEAGGLADEMMKKYLDLLQKQVLVQKRLHDIRLRKAEFMLEEGGVPSGEVIVRKELQTDVKVNCGRHSIEIREPRDKQRIYPDADTGRLVVEPYRGKDG